MDKELIEKEVLIRGTCITLKVKNLTFGQRVRRLEEVIQNHHPDLKSKYENLFLLLDNFCIIRNRLVHCPIIWNEEDENEIEIWDVTEAPNKFQYYVPEKILLTKIKNELSNLFLNITHPLIELRNEIRSRLMKADPKLFQVLESEVSKPPEI